MATKKKKTATLNMNDWRGGRLNAIDNLPPGDPKIGSALVTFADEVNTNRNSRHWVRSVQWVENFLFSLGRHYIDDILISRLSRDSDGNQSIINEATKNIPRPVNDLLGRYIETNISLLTENKPIPRIIPKSSRAEPILGSPGGKLSIEFKRPPTVFPHQIQ